MPGSVSAYSTPTGPAGPSLPSVMGALGSVVGLGMAIGNKLDQAEYNSEYNNGLEYVRREIAKFNQGLDQNPDYTNYGKMWSEKENVLTTYIDQNIKNTHAKNDLMATWQQMRDSQEENIYSISNGVRVKTYYADLVRRGDGRYKDVTEGTLSADDAIKASEIDLKQAVDTGVIDPKDAYVYGEKIAGQMQYEEALRKVRTVALDEGWESAIGSIGSVVKGYNKLTLNDADSIETQLTREQNIARVEHNRKVGENNSKIENDIEEELKVDNYGKAEKILNSGKFMDIDGGLSAADNWWQWHQRIEEGSRAALAEKRALEKDNPVADGFLIDATNEYIEPGTTVRNARDALIKKDITFNQYKAVQAAVSPRVKGMAAPYEAEFKTDSSMKQEVVAAMNLSLANFRSWISNNMDSSEETIKAKADSMHKDALKGIVKDAVNKRFAPGSYEASVASAVNAVKGGKPLDVRSMQSVQNSPEVKAAKATPVDKGAGALMKKGVTAAHFGTTAKGEPIYKDSKGLYYWQDPAGAWYSSSDGKKWQILK
jgi:hypothetical protein